MTTESQQIAMAELDGWELRDVAERTLHIANMFGATSFNEQIKAVLAKTPTDMGAELVRLRAERKEYATQLIQTTAQLTVAQHELGKLTTEK